MCNKGKISGVGRITRRRWGSWENVCVTRGKWENVCVTRRRWEDVCVRRGK